MLHDGIEGALKRPTDVAIKCAECVGLDQRKIVFHLLLAFFIGDTTEYEPLPSVKRENKT